MEFQDLDIADLEKTETEGESSLTPAEYGKKVFESVDELLNQYKDTSPSEIQTFLANMSNNQKLIELEKEGKEVMKKFHTVLASGAASKNPENPNVIILNGSGDGVHEMQSLMAVEVEHPPLPYRSIIHLDVDCFECQVWLSEFDEAWAKRPCVTVNPPSRLTSVNYPARATGIKRSMNLREAKIICPELTIFVNDSHSLDPWSKHRDVSNCILDSIQKVIGKYGFHKVVIDQASKDEFYIDVTEETRLMGNILEAWFTEMLYNEKGIKVMIENEDGSIRLDRNFIEKWMDAEERVRLVTGGAIAKLFCDAIRIDTNIECSAGVGENKLMARLCCGMNKPNSVSIMTHNGYPRVAKSTALDKLAGLGGVLGQKIKDDFEITTIAELKTLDAEELDISIGRKTGYGNKLHSWANGVHHEDVTENLIPPSITTAKSFSILHNPVDLETLRCEFWILAHRIVFRIHEDFKRYNRLPVKAKMEVTTSSSGHYSFELLPASWIDINAELLFGIIQNILSTHFLELETNRKMAIDEIRLSIRQFEEANTVLKEVEESSCSKQWSLGQGRQGILKEPGLLFKEVVGRERAQQSYRQLFQLRYGQENREVEHKLRQLSYEELQAKVETLTGEFGRPISSPLLRKLAHDELYNKPIKPFVEPNIKNQPPILRPTRLWLSSSSSPLGIDLLFSRFEYLKDQENLRKLLTKNEIILAKMNSTHLTTRLSSYGMDVVPPARPTPESLNFLQYIHGSDKPLGLGKNNHPLSYRMNEFWGEKIYKQNDKFQVKSVANPKPTKEKSSIDLYHGDFRRIALQAEYVNKNQYGLEQRRRSSGRGGCQMEMSKILKPSGIENRSKLCKEVKIQDDNGQSQMDEDCAEEISLSQTEIDENYAEEMKIRGAETATLVVLNHDDELKVGNQVEGQANMDENACQFKNDTDAIGLGTLVGEPENRSGRPMAFPGITSDK